MGLLKLTLKQLIDLGYPESVAKRIVSGELPMDTKSRIGRLNAAGLNERAFRGVGKEGQKSRSGIEWLSTDPDLASGYAHMRGMETGEHVTPVLVDAGDSVNFRHAEQRKPITEFLGDIIEQMDDAGRGFMDESIAESQFNSIKSRFKQTDEINKYWQDKEVADFIRNAGFDSIRAPEGGARGVDTIGLVNPSANRRSIFAAGDPSYKGSNILGSRIAPTATTGLLGLSALNPDDTRAAEILATDSRDVGSIQAADHPKLQQLAGLLGAIDTPIGKPFENLPNSLLAMAYSDDPDLKRAFLSALDIAP